MRLGHLNIDSPSFCTHWDLSFIIDLITRDSLDTDRFCCLLHLLCSALSTSSINSFLLGKAQVQFLHISVLYFRLLPVFATHTQSRADIIPYNGHLFSPCVLGDTLVTILIVRHVPVPWSLASVFLVHALTCVTFASIHHGTRRPGSLRWWAGDT
jgi:hypothetical protein